jgi:hypothetical protein
VAPRPRFPSHQCIVDLHPIGHTIHAVAMTHGNAQFAQDPMRCRPRDPQHLRQSHRGNTPFVHGV